MALIIPYFGGVFKGEFLQEFLLDSIKISVIIITLNLGVGYEKRHNAHVEAEAKEGTRLQASDEDERRKGYLKEATQEKKVGALCISLRNHSNLRAYIRRANFLKEIISY